MEVKFLDGQFRDQLGYVPSANIRFKEAAEKVFEEECMEAFEDIDNHTIERYYNNYINYETRIIYWFNCFNILSVTSLDLIPSIKTP